ncbi:hypothetical protein [Brevundimonas sp.]|uniref:hypothetical protein n=1 Tax=Brevundimonas sp. TaxID=1871086 RepID=UPI002EDA181C
MARIQALVCGMAALVVAGCQTTAGSIPIVDADGPRTPAATRGVVGRFASAAQASFAAPSGGAQARAMLDEGFALIYANCSDYFASAGETQQWILVGQDVIAAAETVGTALLLLDGEGEQDIARLALGAGAANSALDVYTQNFLFSAENIDAVRTLVTSALTVHRNAVLGSGSYTYSTAINQLQDNQAICAPRRIAALAREAIKNGDVQPVVQTGIVSVVDSQDQRALLELGALLTPPGTLGAEQAGALYWLFENSPSPADLQPGGPIADRLGSLADSPLDANGYKTGWAKEAAVRAALRKLSEPTRQGFAEAIANYRSNVVKGLTGNLAEAALDFRVYRSAPASGAGHVAVEVR